MKKFVLIGLFFLFTPVNLVISCFALAKISQSGWLETPIQNQALIAPTSVILQSSQLFAALPQPVGEVLGVVTASDARPLIVQKYLRKYRSPMAPHYQDLLLAAEQYGVDPWLIIAIAQCESNLCKKAPADSYNCWGFENGGTKFLSWKQAFDNVAKTLKERYLDFGLETPEEIMPKYAPPSLDKGGPWAKCVNQFIQELELGEVE